MLSSGLDMTEVNSCLNSLVMQTSTESSSSVDLLVVRDDSLMQIASLAGFQNFGQHFLKNVLAARGHGCGETELLKLWL